MSIGDFVSLFVRAAFGVRWVRGEIAATLAVCIVCFAVNDGQAAANSSAAFVSMPFIAPVSPSGADEPTSQSFKQRFDVPQTSLTRDIRASLIRYVALAPLTTASLPRHRKIVPAAAAITGIASTYNPTDPSDRDSGNEETASGERYDAKDWTAAIRTDLRAQFGGVRFGKNYRAAFALVQSSDKQAIVRINDVGPLKRGRIIDLNERAMRYFDPTLQIGLLDNVRVTPLSGQDWALGPVDDEKPVNFASRFDQPIR